MFLHSFLLLACFFWLQMHTSCVLCCTFLQALYIYIYNLCLPIKKKVGRTICIKAENPISKKANVDENTIKD